MLRGSAGIGGEGPEIGPIWAGFAAAKGGQARRPVRTQNRGLAAIWQLLADADFVGCVAAAR